jgi:ribonuclease P protein subunit RPR2
MAGNFKHKFQEIAKTRIDYLFDLAKASFKEGFSSRYMQIASDISKKHKVRLTKGQKFFFCRKCRSFIFPGINARHRLKNKRVVITCNCGHKRRIPLN